MHVREEAWMPSLHLALAPSTGVWFATASSALVVVVVVFIVQMGKLGLVAIVVVMQ